jgi:hypothetical protein
MPATMSVLSNVSGTISGQTVSIGSRTTPATFALVSDIYSDEAISVANDATATLFQSGSTGESVAAFGYGVVLSTKDVLLEITCDQDNSVGRHYMIFKVRANIPFHIPRSYSKANYDGSFGGTDDNIDKIRVKNSSGESATVRLLLVQ